MLCWKEASADDALDEHEWSPFDRVGVAPKSLTTGTRDTLSPENDDTSVMWLVRYGQNLESGHTHRHQELELVVQDKSRCV
jgi:hypothetical protein